ncbi:NAD-dependent epimerase/dehydratase family protein [Paractinoplanes rishiriensis]|uniref:NDP-sugar dehydratase or epimerase n=1 Tax=Paractinoplanes rishiriensis TaxID=1050105 RepID=A0A919JY89_9ACTN|nr:NAD-dependent epimerase/dehydratase family protein [Actinoplanes rishiriensis]GIE93161.1 NDP-sugar dehydratase or epimerase [Actinoplanes rishiriensis]
MNVVVTGGAGFIGANLCRALVDQPGIDRVVAYDNLSTGNAANLAGAGVELVVGDIRDQGPLREVLDRADAVVHLAARPSVPRSLADPFASHDANVTGTVNLLEACRRSGAHLVAASSSSVYGATPDLPKHEGLATRPLSPYAASKLAAESYALAYAASFGLPTLVLRFFNVYGPFQSTGHAYAAAIPAFVHAALNGEPLTVQGDGQQTRDFTFVGSVVDVLTQAVLCRVTADAPVNLAFGESVSIRQVIELIGELLDRDLNVRYEPARPGDVRHSHGANDRLRSLFPGLAPIALAEGLRQTIDWFAGTGPYPVSIGRPVGARSAMG